MMSSTVLLFVGILLQLLGGTLFGVGLLGSKEGRRIASAAKTHLQGYRRLLDWHLPQLFDVSFSMRLLVFHLILSWVLIGVLYGIALLVDALHLARAEVTATVLGVIMIFIVGWLLTTCRSRADLLFVFTHPVIGFVPLVVAVPFLLSFVVKLLPAERLVASAVLVPSVYLAVAFTAGFSWAVSFYVRLVLIIAGVSLYALGTTAISRL